MSEPFNTSSPDDSLVSTKVNLSLFRPRFNRFHFTKVEGSIECNFKSQKNEARLFLDSLSDPHSEYHRQIYGHTLIIPRHIIEILYRTRWLSTAANQFS